VTPTLGAAVRLSALAFRREAWLVALALLVAGLRRAVTWPAAFFAWALVLRAALGAASRQPLDLAAPLGAAAAVVGSARFLGIVGGLWLAGALTAGALRVVWIAGAVPSLGAAMGGRPSGPAGFAEGVASTFVRVLPAAVLGFLLELGGALFAAAVALGTVLMAVRASGAAGGEATGLAALTALALTLALGVPLALSTVADALVARAALRAEGAATALAGATRRFLSRPGAFLLGAMLFGAAGLAAQLAVQAFGGVATGFARGVPPLALLGPRLWLGVLSAGGAAVVDLLWLGTVAVLSAGRTVTTASSAGWRSSAAGA
jgi:hypothetical protein